MAYEKVPKYINSCEISVAPLTTGREKSGSSAIKIYEYLACGKPVIAFDVPDIAFLETEHCGIIVPRDDVSALANVTVKLLQNPEKIKNMSESGRKPVIDNYSWENTERKIVKLLQDVI